MKYATKIVDEGRRRLLEQQEEEEETLQLHIEQSFEAAKLDENKRKHILHTTSASIETARYDFKVDGHLWEEQRKRKRRRKGENGQRQQESAGRAAIRNSPPV